MDDVDRAIINIIQSDFPITARPYLEISERVHVGEQEVLDRIKILKKKGIIRRIGGNFRFEAAEFHEYSVCCEGSKRCYRSVCGGGEPIPGGDPQLSQGS